MLESSMSHMDAAFKQSAGSPAMNLLMLPAAMLSEVLARLPAHTRVLTMPLVSRALLTLVEEDCELLCKSHGWVLPRRPRGIGAYSTRHPYRHLYLSKSCVCCIAVGDFCARESSNSHARFLLCGPCARSEAGHARLVPHNLKLDLTGLSGKALYTARGDRFCAAMHADGAKRRARPIMTLDASGAAFATGVGKGRSGGHRSARRGRIN